MRAVFLGRAIVGLCVLGVSPLCPAQSFTTVHTFTDWDSYLLNNVDGTWPYAGLCTSEAEFYGVAAGGGAYGGGVIFRMDPNGAGFIVLHNFTALDPVAGTNTDGAVPYGGLVVSGGMVFGSTINGGLGGNGTLFCVGTNGESFATLHSFTSVQAGPSPNPNGEASPYSSLTLSGKTLYGTASWGGTNAVGSIFSIGTNGDGFATLHQFAGPDGKLPFGNLWISGDTVYGTTWGGGGFTNGTLFALGTNGSGFRLIHEFGPFGASQTNTEGAAPWGGVVQSGPRLYGTAYWGGSNGCGSVFSVNTNGTGFTVLHGFSGSSDGLFPIGSLVAAGTTLFGTTTFGGSNNNGTVFSVGTDGSGFRVIHTFEAYGENATTNWDGAVPQGPLVQFRNSLYGTTVEGGSFGMGVVFRLDFLSASPPVRNKDGTIQVAWSGLAGSTNVTDVATSLAAPADWQGLATNIADASGSWSVADAAATNYPARFYRSVPR